MAVEVAFNDFTGRGVECDAEWSFAEPGTWSKPRVAVRIPGFGDLDPLQILTDPLDTLRNPLRLLPLPFRFFENREKKDR